LLTRLERAYPPSEAGELSGQKRQLGEFLEASKLLRDELAHERRPTDRAVFAVEVFEFLVANGMRPKQDLLDQADDSRVMKVFEMRSTTHRISEWLDGTAECLLKICRLDDGGFRAPVRASLSPRKSGPRRRQRRQEIQPPR